MALKERWVIITIFIFTFLLVFYSNQIVEFFGQYSYIGIFILSLLSSASLFLPLAPVQLAVVMLSMKLNIVYCAILAGIGSAIGESTGYIFGKELKEILKEKKQLKQNEIFKKIYNLNIRILKNHTYGAIFLLSFFPNPIFDIVGVYAGIKKVKYPYYLLLTSVGRILRFYFLIETGIRLNGLLNFF
ncbi:MAG: VTT domain-containing protein [Candidatus Anstonellaceae archaeon]